MPDLVDTEPCAGTGSSALICLYKAFSLLTNDGCARLELLSTSLGKGSCGTDVEEECYLVDPASSHMLVSKIKPCMCKYELIQTVKLRMAH